MPVVQYEQFEFEMPTVLNGSILVLVPCINVTNVKKKTCQFKTWCKGDKSNIENSTYHFCEDTRQNALAALTNLGHVTTFLLLGPTSFDDTMGERNHFSGQQITRSDRRSSHKI